MLRFSDAHALVQLEDEFSELDVGSIGDAFASLDSDPDDDDDEPPNTLLERSVCRNKPQFTLRALTLFGNTLQ